MLALVAALLVAALVQYCINALAINTVSSWPMGTVPHRDHQQICCEAS